MLGRIVLVVLHLIQMSHNEEVSAEDERTPGLEI